MSGNYEQMNLLIHAGLRRDLGRIGQVARQPLTPERRAAVSRRTTWLVWLLHLHHTGEDQAIWPRAVRKRPALGALLRDMDAEHHAIDEAADRLTTAAARFADDPAESHRQSLVEAHERLSAVCLRHLDHEESEAVPLLMETLDDREWAQVDKDFRRGARLRDVGWIAMWLLDDLEPAGIDHLRAELTAPVLELMKWRWGGAYDREAALAWGDLARPRTTRGGAHAGARGHSRASRASAPRA